MSTSRDSRLGTWGWDGCYLADRDHAAAQPHHRGREVTIEVGPGQRFATTASWAAEAQEAVRLFQSVPRDVTVNGGGMIAAILGRFGFGRSERFPKTRPDFSDRMVWNW